MTVPAESSGRNHNCVAHCTANELRAFRFRDGDTSLAAERDATASLQRSPNGGGVVTNEPRYRFATEPALVKPSEFVPVHDSMAGLVLLGRKWAQVSWAVVCLDPISVVDFLMWEDPSDGAVFIGIDVIFGAQSPVKGDVAVTGHVSRKRLVLRERLSSPQIAAPSMIRGAALGAAPSLPGRVGYINATDYAGDGVYRTATRHSPIVLLRGACDAHFTGLAPFDAHRVGGYCVDPSEPRFGENSRRAGQPILQAIDGRCDKLAGCWKDGKRLHYVEGVSLWQMSVDPAETLQGALW